MKKYGVLDASYQAAGKEVGIRKLVDDFYHHMETQKRGQQIRAMHREDLETIKDKLSLFLMSWLGGPRNYADKYGGISIPGVHKHLDIKQKQRDAWLFCMQKALEDQEYDDDFKCYLLEQLAVPAERIRQVSQMVRG